MIEITVRTDKEESCYKVSPEHTTVGQIKQLVLGSSFDGFSLKWEGKVLDDTDTLSKCGIAIDVTMSLQPRHRAGGGGKSKPTNAAGGRGGEINQEQVQVKVVVPLPPSPLCQTLAVYIYILESYQDI